MPPAAKGNLSVILFDLKMNRSTAIEILERIIVHCSMVRPADTAVLVLTNSSESNNSKKYPNIYEVTTNVKYTTDMLLPLEEEHEIKDSNWLDAIDLAVYILGRSAGLPSVITKQIIYLTSDFGDCNGMETSKGFKWVDVVNKLNENDIFLYIFGPETTFKKTIRTKEDVREAMRDRLKNVNNGVVCGADYALDYLAFFNNTILGQRSSEALTFDKEESFEIMIESYRIIDETSLPYTLQKISNFEPKNKEEKICVDTVEAYTFMDKAIHMPKDIEESLKYNGGKMFRIIGFVDQHKIQPTTLFGGETHAVLADSAIEDNSAFYSFLDACIKTKKYPLALKVYRANVSPKLFVLFPKPPDRFLMVPHSEYTVDNVTISDATTNGTNISPALLDKFNAYLTGLQKSPLPLHPTVEVGKFQKSYVDKLRMLMNEKENVVDVKIKINDGVATSDVLSDIDELMKKDEETLKKMREDELKEKIEKDEEDW